MMTEEQKKLRDDITEAYREVMPAIERGEKIDPYFFNWVAHFSPIESMAWGVVRTIGLPLYPEYPACGYYIDFADPVKMIGVELDGAQFHDVKRDMKRDLNLWKKGWSIIRITGMEMNGIDVYDVEDRLMEMSEYDYPPEEIDEEKEKLVKQWINTGDGVFHAIGYKYYNKHKGLLSCLHENQITEILKQRSYLPIR